MAGISELESAQREVYGRLAAIDESHYGDPTPCSEWAVRDLARHLYSGSQSSAGVLSGAAPSATGAGELADAELAAAIAASFRGELEAFSAPGRLEATISHPRAGEMTGEAMLGLRLGDYVLHSWDLAKAAGESDITLPPELVELVYARLSPMAPMLAQSGAFGTGPSGTVADDAPLQERLLDLSGRRP